MANPTRIIKSDSGCIMDFVPSAAIGASGTSNAYVGAESYSGVTLFLNVTAASGSAQTLDVILQKLLPDGATWMDIAAFAQLTSAALRTLDFVSGGSQFNTPVDGSLAASSILTTLLGSTLRIKYVIGGTSPSFTFQVSAEFLP